MERTTPSDRVRSRRWAAALIGVGAVVLTGCPPVDPDPGSTTTTSGATSTTTSTSTSTTTTSTPPPPVGTVTRLVSGGASSAVISRNGRFVAYTSTNDAPGTDGNGGDTDVFLHDRQTSSTVRVTGGNGPSRDPSVSDTGAVVFRSAATDLVAGTDTNDRLDVFFWSAADGMIRVTDSAADVGAPLISADGTTAVFGAPESLVTPGGSSRTEAVRWRLTDRTTLVALTEAGSEGASPVAVSADGSRVLLAEPGRLSLSETPATPATVVANAPASPPAPQVTTFSVAPHALAADGDVVFAEVTYSFDDATGLLSFQSGVLRRWDRQGAAVSSVPAGAAPAGPVTSDDGVRLIVAEQAGVSVDQDAGRPFLPGAIRAVDIGGATQSLLTTADGSFGTVSADGRYVAFVSTSTALAPPDTNGADADVYLWDRGA